VIAIDEKDEEENITDENPKLIKMQFCLDKDEKLISFLRDAIAELRAIENISQISLIALSIF
jgi:hypothetical protein